MKNFKFINQSLWAGSSPNQTGETQTRQNRHGVLSYFYRTFVLLFMLLTLGVGQMWAGAGLYEVYFEYSYSGTNSSATYTDKTSSTQTISLGTLTADFKLTSIYPKVWKDGSGNICGCLVEYYISSDEEITGFSYDKSLGDNNHQWKRTDAFTVAQYNSGASGSYTFWYRFKAWGSSSSSSNCNDDSYYIPTGGVKNKFTYSIAPPAVSGFGVSTSGYLAGSGTSEDPYLVKSGNSLTFTVSGSKARNDDNSTLKYWLNSGSKQNSNTITISNITATTNQSAVIHAQCINNTTSSLVGTESTSTTIYYKAVDVKDITVYIYVGGCTDDQKNNLVLTGTPYVGSVALAGVNINSAGFTTDGNWKTYTFNNVSKVHNLQVAGFAGAIPLANIENATENFYYRMYTGTVLADKCIPAPSLPWTTAPANGIVGGANMTAVVNTSAVSGGSPSVTWSTSNSSIANVNSSTGEISYVAAGSATITASVSWSANGDYCAGSQNLAQEITVSTTSDSWSLWYYGTSDTKIGDFTPDGGDSYHLDFDLTDANYLTLWLKNNSTQYIVENINANTVTNKSVTAFVGRFRDDAAKGRYRFRVYKVESAWKLDATPMYAVSYDGNGQSDGTAPSTTYHLAGSNVTVASNSGSLTKTGYNFGGWNENSSGTGTDYVAGSGVISSISANKTLYAKWIGNPTTVTLDMQDGSDGSASVTATYGSAMPSATMPTRTGFTFNGYYASKGGSGTKYYNADGSSAHIWDQEGDAITIYAYWISVPTVTTPIVSRSTIDVDGITPLTISATSTNLADPVVIFTISDGANSYKLTASTGEVGTDPAYTTVHKATFTPPTHGTWTVTAATLYEGKLIDNMGTNNVYWETAGSGGSKNKVLNPYTQAGTKYEKDSVIQIGRAASGDNWGGALTKKASGTPYGYTGWSYVHTMQYRTAEGETRLKVNDGEGCRDDRTATSALSIGTWQEVMYNIGSCTFDFAFIQPSYGNTTDYTVYVDDIILLKESSLAAAQRATIETSVAITAYQMFTVTLTNATVSSVSAGQATGVSITASPALEGQKFDHWEVSGGASVEDANNRTTTVTASSAGTVTAVYTDREYVKIYFKAPGGDWNPPYAYVWDADGPADDYNAAYPGVAMSTETVNCVEYYYYKYYIDNNGEGSDLTAQADWDKVIFNKGSGSTTEYPNESWNKTRTLNIADGHFYFYHCAANSTGSAYGSDWYLRGNFNGSNKWDSWEYPININCETNEGYVDMADLNSSNTQYFRIYQISTEKEFRISSSASNAEVSIGTEYTLHNQSSAADYFTPVATTDYRFTLNVATPSAPVLTVVPNENTPYSATLSKNGHGSLSVGTGDITLKQYIPTTITATPEPGYRFTGWTTTGSVAYAGGTSSSDATASFIATADGGTITANFSNSEVIYFDAGNIENEWGDEVYVTFLNANFEWNDGDGKDGALIVKNWVNDALHSVRMTRIPNTRIFYLDYSNLSGHDQVTQYVLFTSKSLPSGIYNLYEMAAVTRGDYSKTTNNMCVAENYREKDKNKTGYYCGYWMNYNDTKAGIKLKVYSGGGAAIDVDDDFTLASGSRTFTAKVTLSAGTTYSLSLQGDNGTWYNNDNSGTMTSLSCTAWPFVDRQSTPGHITTTAGGEYTFTLNCADKLYLTADFPLAVNDYKLVFSGKVAVGGIDETYSSSVIRHIGDEGTKKDTLGFFVVNGDSWTLQLKRCTSIDPITWVNVGDAKTASAFGNPATGTYNFVVQQDSSTGTPVTPAFATMTPEAYTGNYYIRTDAADGGWEAYKKALDNQMTFSNYAKSQSNFDYYHCRFANNGTNVKFCIANDYSARLSDTLYTDSYVNTGEGILPADASVRFMWNSETNVLNRAYLNGSHTTDFLLLEAKGDSLKNFDGTAIAGAGILGSVKFKDMGNWIYQKEVQALPGTRVRLTSNYHFSSSDHIQYFKGESGDWSETGANTEQIIGGTTTGWEKLRLVYDFKTNHLTSAWLPPTDPIDEAKSINADMLLIRRGQNAAQQLTFGGSGKIANVKTIVGAMEFVKDSIVGRVSNFNGDVIGAGGNRANRELMHYISFPFDVAVNDIYGFGQLNKEWYLQYYDGADRARKGFFRGDGTTTFWKFMTLSDTLRANVGYSLLLDNDYFNTDGEGTVWHNTISDFIYLYFPSVKELSSDSVIKSGTKAIRVPEHKHTSGRTFEVESRTLCHDFTDSNWNMMGVPLFHNKTGLDAHFGYVAVPTDWPGDGKGYFYEWDSLRNNFEIHTAVGYTFKSMHGYMVQYSGEVSFTGASIQPAASVAARRSPMSDEDYTLEMQLLKNNQRVSRAYVELRDEACDTFALNEDVYMVYTSLPADLYTYAGNYDVSANVLSVDNHVVPVGIEVHQAGVYTFTMPDNFSGGVTLVDNVLDTRTNLALSDYEVTLPKGICDGRFYLELDIQKSPTSIDVIEEGGSLKDGKAHKFIQNGVMYILQNGMLYDAQGKRIQ